MTLLHLALLGAPVVATADAAPSAEADADTDVDTDVDTDTDTDTDTDADADTGEDEPVIREEPNCACSSQALPGTSASLGLVLLGLVGFRRRR